MDVLTVRATTQRHDATTPFRFPGSIVVSRCRCIGAPPLGRFVEVG